MLDFKEKTYVKRIPRGRYILAGDVGGTNTNFGILKGSKPKLYLSLHFKSKEITNFTDVVEIVVKHLRTKYNVLIDAVCVAAAGINSGKELCLTNRNFCINSRAIKKRIKIHSFFLINDFDAISYGINVLEKKTLLTIKLGVCVEKAPKIVLGAGTGLGKGFMFYDQKDRSYVAYSSEGGHGDAVALGYEDRELFSFIQKETKVEVIEWEDILSGEGLLNLYHYVGHLKKYKNTKLRAEIKTSSNPGILITKYSHKDPRSRDAYQLFLKFYARCAKNFALDLLSFGGVYIAGGIAASNPELFEHKTFIKEFMNTKKQKEILRKIPVFLIKDYNVSLYGCASVALKRKYGKKN